MQITHEVVQHPLIDPQDPGISFAYVIEQILLAGHEADAWAEAEALSQRAEEIALETLSQADLDWFLSECEGISDHHRRRKSAPDRVIFHLGAISDEHATSDDEEELDDEGWLRYGQTTRFRSEWDEFVHNHRPGMC